MACPSICENRCSSIYENRCSCCENPKYQWVNRLVLPYSVLFFISHKCRWILWVLTLLCWILSIVSVASCEFFIDERFRENSNGSGIFKTENRGNCVGYTSTFVYQHYQHDPAHRAGKTFGVMATLFLTAALIMYPLVIFVLRDVKAQRVWFATRIMDILALLCVILTFSYLASDVFWWK